MRTRRSISTVCARASRAVTSRWRRMASAICSPTVNTGFGEVIGSWKIIDSLSPRRLRSRSSESFSRSSPSNSISPAAMRPGGGTNPMMLSAMTLLPQPDSPTMPSVRPRSSRRSTPSTALTSPRVSPLGEANTVRSPRTSSKGTSTWFIEAGNFFFYRLPVEYTPGPRLARRAAHERDEALVSLLVQAPELCQRFCVVVDAQAELGVLLGGVDEEGGRLLAAFIAARCLACLERSNEPLRKWKIAVALIGALRFAD